MTTMSSSIESAIEAEGLVKHYGNVRAVDGVSLHVERGTIYGLLGPNGAGKTTIVRLLSTLIRPDAGVAHVLGYDVVREQAQVRSRISLTGQFASVDKDLTGHENLVLLARLFGFSWRDARRRSRQMLRAFDLVDAGNRRVEGYSGGMRRRLDIAASLLRSPELLFLDEPTTGLDPRSRGQVWDIIRNLVSQGTTVVLTTQYLEEADHLADRIAVIDHGRIVAEGTTADLKASVGIGFLHVRLARASDHEHARHLLREDLGAVVRADGDPKVLTATVSDTSRTAQALVSLNEAGIEVSEYSFGRPSLDEVFFMLTDRRTEEAP